MKKLVSVALIGAMLAISLQGCTDEEAVVAGAVIGAVVGAAIAKDSNDNNKYKQGYQCVGGYRRVCHEWIDHRGRRRRECRERWDSCKYRKKYYYRTALYSGLEEHSEITDITLAQTFKLGFEGSDILKIALDEAKRGNLKELNKIGISNATLKVLAKGEVPSSYNVQMFADSLDITFDHATEVLKGLSEIASAQIVNSDLSINNSNKYR